MATKSGEQQRTSSANIPITSVPKGLVVGIYWDRKDTRARSLKLTASGSKFNCEVGGKLLKMVQMALPPPTLGQVRVLYGLHDIFTVVAVVGLGEESASYNASEELDEQKEAIRVAAGAGAKALQDLNLCKIYVDSMGHAESAAEGASLGVWLYQENKSDGSKKTLPKVELYDSNDWIGWQVGQEKASAQNLARQLMESPANILTPTAFSMNAVEELTKSGVNVEVKVRNWAKLRNFNAFLSVASGSCQAPIFLEASYEGCDPDLQPIVLIGKGVTFDAGGICAKSSHEMKHMRGDMAGAACVLATMRAVSSLQIPVNIRGLIPLCENMPGACAFKPGDIIKAQNGKSILVQDTSYEGQLILADALSYSSVYKPKFILDVGSMSPDLSAAIATSASAVFTNCDSLYEVLRIASIHTGDRVWRFPLWEFYRDEVVSSERSDVVNVGDSKNGAGCNAAAFLQQFVPPGVDWVHVDCYGVGRVPDKEAAYLRQGMSGRPTRTLIEFISQLACQP